MFSLEKVYFIWFYLKEKLEEKSGFMNKIHFGNGSYSLIVYKFWNNTVLGLQKLLRDFT